MVVENFYDFQEEKKITFVAGTHAHSRKRISNERVHFPGQASRQDLLDRSLRLEDRHIAQIRVLQVWQQSKDARTDRLWNHCDRERGVRWVAQAGTSFFGRQSVTSGRCQLVSRSRQPSAIDLGAQWHGADREDRVVACR